MYKKLLLKRINEMNKNGEKKVIKTWSRSSTIFPQMIGILSQFMMEENMCQFIYLEDMVGHKLGEFALTRTFKGHIDKRKN